MRRPFSLRRGPLLRGNLSLSAALILASTVAAGQSPAESPGPFFGGSFGLGFGDVSYFEFSPLAGTYLSPRLSAGGSLIYRHRRDERYRKDLVTNDYGGSVFGRYHFSRMLFAHTEIEYLDYEFYDARLEKDSDSAVSVFLGGGFNAPLSERLDFFALTLYNVNHDEEDSPYDYPWIVRIGLGMGF